MIPMDKQTLLSRGKLPVKHVFCHRNFGPGNFGPGDQNFQWKIGPAGPIFLEKWSASGKLVRIISALVTSDCCG